MRIIAALVLVLSMATTGHAANVVWRSSSSGVLPSPAAVAPLPPDAPAGFQLSFAGTTSLAAGTVLDVHPVVVGSPGKIVTYLLFGALPLGATFDAPTGRIGGRALKPGNYRLTISATDSTGATAAAVLVIIVT